MESSPPSPRTPLETSQSNNRIKYYNNCLFHSVQRDFIAQTGDPTGTGSGGESVWSRLAGGSRFFAGEAARPGLAHDRRGLLGAPSAKGVNGSQFYVTLGDGPFRSLDGRHTLFGEVAEGMDVLERLNEAPVDGGGAANGGGGGGGGGGDGSAAWRPCRNVR